MKKSRVAMLVLASCLMACGCSDSGKDSGSYETAAVNPNSQSDIAYTTNGQRAAVDSPIDIQWCQTVYVQEEVSLKTGLHAYAQVFANGVTGIDGTHEGIAAQVGFFQQAAFTGAEGDEALSYIYWEDAVMNEDFDCSSTPAYDEYMVHGTQLKAAWGRSRIFFRFSGDGGYHWTYCGSEGIMDFTVENLLKYARPFSIEFKTSTEMLDDMSKVDHSVTPECSPSEPCGEGMLCVLNICVKTPDEKPEVVGCGGKICKDSEVCSNGKCVTACTDVRTVLDPKTNECVCAAGMAMSASGICEKVENETKWVECDSSCEVDNEDGSTTGCLDACQQDYGNKFKAWCDNADHYVCSDDEPKDVVIDDCNAETYVESCSDNTVSYCINGITETLKCVDSTCRVRKDGYADCTKSCTKAERNQIISYACETYFGKEYAIPMICSQTKDGDYAAFGGDTYEECSNGCSAAEGCIQKETTCEYYNCTDDFGEICKANFNLRNAICNDEGATCITLKPERDGECAEGESAGEDDGELYCARIGRDKTCLAQDSSDPNADPVVGSSCDPKSNAAACSADLTKRYFCDDVTNKLAVRYCSDGTQCEIVGSNTSSCVEPPMPDDIPASCVHGESPAICASDGNAWFCSRSNNYYLGRNCDADNPCFVCESGLGGCGIPACGEESKPAQSGNVGDSCDQSTFKPYCINGDANAIVCGYDGTIKQWDCAGSVCSYNAESNRVNCPKPKDNEQSSTSTVGSTCDFHTYTPTCINDGANALVCRNGIIELWPCANNICNYYPDLNRVDCPSSEPVSGGNCIADTYPGFCSPDLTKRYYCNSNNQISEKTCNEGTHCVVMGQNSSRCLE